MSTFYGPVQPSSVTNGAGEPMDPRLGRGGGEKKRKSREMRLKTKQQEQVKGEN